MLFLFPREVANTDYSQENAGITFQSLSPGGDGKMSVVEMEAILRKDTREALDEEEITTVRSSSAIIVP